MPDPVSSPTARLAEAARDFARQRLGKAALPVRVVVTLDGQLELEGIAVEVAGPPAPDDADGGNVSACLRDIIATLARTSRRLPTMALLTALDDAGLTWGEGTVKATLAAAVKAGLIDNNTNTGANRNEQHWYGLPGRK
jgi:hypothetical protein